MIKIVRGNNFTLLSFLKVQTGVDAQGNPVLVPFTLTGDEEVSVSIKNNIASFSLPFRVEGSCIYIDIDGTKIKNGTYDVEIIVKNEGNMRSMNRNQFAIVESNQESDLSGAADFEVQVHQLDNTVFLGGGSGSEASDYNMLGNKPRINSVELEGNKSLETLGIQPAGDYISDPDYVHTDYNFTKDFMTKLESLNSYDDTGLQASVAKLKQSLDTLMNGDVNGVIDSFNEIEAFLSGITESDSLTKMLSDLRSYLMTEINKKINREDISEWAKQPEKPIYTASEVGALPKTTAIPTKVSQLQNDSNYATTDLVTPDKDGLMPKEDKSKVDTLKEMYNIYPVLNEPESSIFPNVFKTPGEFEELIDKIRSGKTTLCYINPTTNLMMAIGGYGIQEDSTYISVIGIIMLGSGYKNFDITYDKSSKYIGLRLTEYQFLDDTCIVDNLTSYSKDKALSAAQGKELNDKIGNIGSVLDRINGEVY